MLGLGNLIVWLLLLGMGVMIHGVDGGINMGWVPVMGVVLALFVNFVVKLFGFSQIDR
ncbi:hypothetical protein BO71DRAFT_162343 [Aspergillus ellipticus CBS 707.79]|uniref:Uncharacterized protein n=1 Tax=Aspergillus ellipticus CBS 707.79 TaxID=1448320 RepID=A0A319CTU5_9EURO|nr:hypothetical protein BO71DRAFT_162343 [Aspergillus ellipticus CBS 707.79]